MEKNPLWYSNCAERSLVVVTITLLNYITVFLSHTQEFCCVMLSKCKTKGFHSKWFVSLKHAPLWPLIEITFYNWLSLKYCTQTECPWRLTCRNKWVRWVFVSILCSTLYYTKFLWVFPVGVGVVRATELCLEKVLEEEVTCTSRYHSFGMGGVGEDFSECCGSYDKEFKGTIWAYIQC